MVDPGDGHGERSGGDNAAGGPPSAADARSWAGYKLDGLDGRTAGRVEGVLVDGRSGEPTWLVVRTGRLRGHSAVPIELAAGGIGHVWVPYSREAIRGAPEIDPKVGLDAESERALCDHYGVPEASGRRALIAAREDQALTSVPAPDGG